MSSSCPLIWFLHVINPSIRSASRDKIYIRLMTEKRTAQFPGKGNNNYVQKQSKNLIKNCPLSFWKSQMHPWYFNSFQISILISEKKRKKKTISYPLVIYAIGKLIHKKIFFHVWRDVKEHFLALVYISWWRKFCCFSPHIADSVEVITIYFGVFLSAKWINRDWKIIYIKNSC